MNLKFLSDQFFAVNSGPVVNVAPGVVFHLFGLPITNSMIYGWLSIALIAFILIKAAKKVTIKPKAGPVQLVEYGVDFIYRLVENSFEDKERGRKYVPFFVTLFFFILLNNWLGLVPGVGEALHLGNTPLLRPFTADLNGTLAAAIFTMALVYSASVKESGGIRKYLSHFFVGNPFNPLYFVIGVLEMTTDLTRVFSLSLRLFLNVTIGEIVIGVFSYLGQSLAPLTALPFTLVELFIGALQAYIFTILSLMYLAIAVNHASHKSGESDLTEDDVPETIGLETEQASNM